MSEVDFLSMRMLYEDAGEHNLFFKVKGCFLDLLCLFCFFIDFEWFN
jgi:hypothetical protein